MPSRAWHLSGFADDFLPFLPVRQLAVHCMAPAQPLQRSLQGQPWESNAFKGACTWHVDFKLLLYTYFAHLWAAPLV